MKTIRRQIASELGMVIPPVRIRDDVGLDSHEYVMRVRGTEVARGGVLAGHQLAMDPGDAIGQLNGVPTTEPAFGLPAVWIADSSRAEAEALGWTVVDAESVMVTHLTETIRAHASELLTRQETRELLDQLKEVNAAVVDEVVPDVLSLGEIQRVLQALLREGVSIRDLGAIVEAIGDKARLTRDPAMLAEYARQALGRTIVGPYLDAEGIAARDRLDPALEQEVAEALVQTADGEFLAMEPMRATALVNACSEQVEAALALGGPAGAAVLRPRPAPPAAARRAVAPAARGVLLQRDPAGCPRRDQRRDRRGSGCRRLCRWRGHGDGDAADNLKTYRGRTLEEVLPKIREELGADAIVVRRREGLAGRRRRLLPAPLRRGGGPPAASGRAAGRGAQRPRHRRGHGVPRRARADRSGRAVRRRARARGADGGRPRGRRAGRRGRRGRRDRDRGARRAGLVRARAPDSAPR